jgi:hypothetical protein
MATYWETKMGQKYKGRTQQGQFKRAADKRAKFSSAGSKIGGFFFGPIGNYFGAQIGEGMSGTSRQDVGGRDDDWYLDTREATLEGIENIHINDAWENVKKGNFVGAVGGAVGGGNVKIPGMSTKIPGGTDTTRAMTLGDISNAVGGSPSAGGDGGDFIQSLLNRSSGDVPTSDLNLGGNSLERNSLEEIGETFDITSEDSILGRAMLNENSGIDEDALKGLGEGWWARWKSGKLSDEELEWVQNNFALGA